MNPQNTTTQTRTDITLDSLITPQILIDLRREFGQSLTEFGLTLKRQIDPRAKRGYTRQYISRLEHGQDPITPELAAAIYNLAARLDDVPAGIGGAVSTTILCQPGQVTPGAFLKRTLTSKRCAGCNVIFIGPGKFHDAECRREYWKRARKEKRY